MERDEKLKAMLRTASARIHNDNTPEGIQEMRVESLLSTRHTVNMRLRGMSCRVAFKKLEAIYYSKRLALCSASYSSSSHTQVKGSEGVGDGSLSPRSLTKEKLADRLKAKRRGKKEGSDEQSNIGSESVSGLIEREIKLNKYLNVLEQENLISLQSLCTSITKENESKNKHDDSIREIWQKNPSAVNIETEIRTLTSEYEQEMIIINKEYDVYSTVMNKNCAEAKILREQAIRLSIPLPFLSLSSSSTTYQDIDITIQKQTSELSSQIDSSLLSIATTILREDQRVMTYEKEQISFILSLATSWGLLDLRPQQGLLHRKVIEKMRYEAGIYMCMCVYVFT